MSNAVGAVGVDFGSVATCIAVAKRGGVEVITNEGSHRETPNIIGFGQTQRFIGEQGASQVRQNIILLLKNEISNFNDAYIKRYFLKKYIICFLLFSKA